MDSNCGPLVPGETATAIALTLYFHMGRDISIASDGMYSTRSKYCWRVGLSQAATVGRKTIINLKDPGKFQF